MDLKTRHFLKWTATQLSLHYIFILVTSFIVAISVMYTTRKMPKMYAATTTVIYGLGSGKQSISSSVIQSFGIPSLSMGGNSVSGLLLREMLLSRTMNADVIKEFHIMEKFNLPNEYLAYLKLMKIVKIVNYELKSIISITVTYSDPQEAANIANFYIQNLIQMNKRLKLSTDHDIVDVLDPATPPPYSIGPSVFKNTVASFIGTALFASLLVILLALLRRQISN